MRKGYPRQLIVSVLIVGLLVALSGGATASEVPQIQGELTIFSAASLTDAFKEMAAHIEEANPSTKLTFNFAGSPTLRTQLAQGARACSESVLSPAGQAILAHHGFLVAGS